MNKSEHLNELASAVSKMQGELKPAKKDSKNPFFKSNYADLSSVTDACREALAKHGLAVTQVTSETEHGLVLHTVLMHSSGQWISGEMPVRPVKNDPQGMGSALTYARRYALQAIVGVAAEDDDGEAAMNRSGNGAIKQAREAEKPTVHDPEDEPDYTIPFGKFRQKRFTEVDRTDLANYCWYILQKSASDGKQRGDLQANVQDFLKRAETYLNMSFDS